jgi:predicted Zn-dependent protease
MSIELTTRNEFQNLVDRALSTATADEIAITLSDTHDGTTRFANNQVTQNVETRRQSLSVRAAFGKRAGSASTTDLSTLSIIDLVERAEAIAKVSPEDPEYMPPLRAQQYTVLPTRRMDTANADAARRLADARRVIELCTAAELEAAGIVTTVNEVFGVAARGGLFAFEPRTEATFSLTATGPDASGWSSNSNRSIDDLGVRERTAIAIDKARKSAKPREIPAGKYTVVLEPSAVAGVFGPLQWVLDAKSYFKETSALSGKLDQQIIDERFTLRNAPNHPSLLGNTFNGEGMPTDFHAWVDRGVLKRLSVDRFTADERDLAPTYFPDAILLEGDASGAAGNVQDLIRAVKRGVLVTNFWYIRSVNPRDLTLTGMTRDGTFLIEDGEVSGGLINFRWHDSPLRVMNAIRGYTAPLDSLTLERGKMMLPALCIEDFNFSSVTRF